MALREAYGSPAEVEPIRSDPNAGVRPKGNTRTRVQRVTAESDACVLVAVSSWVSSGFTAGCLKKWLLVNLKQPL